MKEIISFSCSILIWLQFTYSQNVGIGTNTPNAKSVLDIQATDKGILFPRLTNAQQNAISNPPNGLHIYNVDDHCLNFYDSTYQYWNCYCSPCEAKIINITANAVDINFYQSYGEAGRQRYVVKIHPNIIISASAASAAALDFSSVPPNTDIYILNYGIIKGNGGAGANGAILASIFCPGFIPPSDGLPGGAAVRTTSNVLVKIKNYGVVGGGGGGGGAGGGPGHPQYGFASNAGGGGAGITPGNGGTGGGNSIFNGSCDVSILCDNGGNGTETAGGAGSISGSCAGTGGNGGGLGQAGQNGTGTNHSNGGAPGKAISGGTGNSIININGGQSFGIVD